MAAKSSLVASPADNDDKPKDKSATRGFTIKHSQYEMILALSAYNQLFNQKPDNASEIVRAALDFYFNNIDLPEHFFELRPDLKPLITGQTD